MADEHEDPPIGTAQNAADVARKAELTTLELNEQAKAEASGNFYDRLAYTPAYEQFTADSFVDVIEDYLAIFQRKLANARS